MSIMDKVKSLLGQHSDQAKGAVGKAGDAVDERTGGKYASQVDTGQDQADKFIDQAKGENTP
jgi:MT0933-like antitoxin protein